MMRAMPSSVYAQQAGRGPPATLVSLGQNFLLFFFVFGELMVSLHLQRRTAAVCQTPVRTEGPVWLMETLSAASAGKDWRAPPAPRVSDFPPFANIAPYFSFSHNCSYR